MLSQQLISDFHITGPIYQYNLLPASMLATAYKYANDSILQGAGFAEVGGFVFSPEQFHKVIWKMGRLLPNDFSFWL